MTKENKYRPYLIIRLLRRITNSTEARLCFQSILVFTDALCPLSNNLLSLRSISHLYPIKNEKENNVNHCV